MHELTQNHNTAHFILKEISAVKLNIGKRLNLSCVFLLSFLQLIVSVHNIASIYSFAFQEGCKNSQCSCNSVSIPSDQGVCMYLCTFYMYMEIIITCVIQSKTICSVRLYRSSCLAYFEREFHVVHYKVGWDNSGYTYSQCSPFASSNFQ